MDGAYVRILNGNDEVLLARHSDAILPERMLTITSNDTPCYGLEINEDGSLTVGRWDENEHWVILHTTPPLEGS